LTVDTGSVDVNGPAREVMPRGADLVFVALEDYINAPVTYLRQAYDVSRVQGTVGILRRYGAAPFGAIDPQGPPHKEITVRHFGNFFGLEPIRGGRARGDWQQSIEGLARGTITSPPAGSRTFDFADITSKDDVDEIFNSLPSDGTKVLLKISA